MNPPLLKTTTVEVEGKVPEHNYLLRASGSREVFAGFRAVYRYAKAEDENGEEEQVNLPLSVLSVGQKQNLNALE